MERASSSVDPLPFFFGRSNKSYIGLFHWSFLFNGLFSFFSGFPPLVFLVIGFIHFVHGYTQGSKMFVGVLTGSVL